MYDKEKSQLLLSKSYLFVIMIKVSRKKRELNKKVASYRQLSFWLLQGALFFLHQWTTRGNFRIRIKLVGNNIIYLAKNWRGREKERKERRYRSDKECVNENGIKPYGKLFIATVDISQLAINIIFPIA